MYRSVELTEFECYMHKGRYNFLRTLNIRVSVINLGVSGLNICVSELNLSV